MASEVKISASADFAKIISALQRLEAQEKKAQTALENANKQASRNLQDNAKRTEQYLERLVAFARRAGQQIRGSFEKLNVEEALKEFGKLGGTMFKGAVDRAVELNNVLAKVGHTLGMSSADFATFQADMTKGLGDIGIAADAGARALDGLAETQVRDRAAMLDYIKMASELASIGRAQGREGEIVKSAVGAVRAKGGNANDPAQVRAMMEAARAQFNVTGQNPVEALNEIKELLRGMSSASREKFGAGTAGGMMAARAVAGPEALTFFREYSQKSALGQLPGNAQGMSKAFGPNGIDPKAFAKWATGIFGRIGFSKEDAAKTLGMSDEAASGMIRLRDNMQAVVDIQNKLAASTGTLEQQYRDSMTAGEAFRASINRVTGKAATPLAEGTEGSRRVLGRLASTDKGAVAAVSAAGLAAAALSTGAFKTALGRFGKVGGIASGLATGAAVQAVAPDVQKVFVVNASDMGGGAMSPIAPGAIGGAAGAATWGATAGRAIAGALGAAWAIETGLTLGKAIGEEVAPHVADWFQKGSTVIHDKRMGDIRTTSDREKTLMEVVASLQAFGKTVKSLVLSGDTLKRQQDGLAQSAKELSRAKGLSRGTETP